MACCGMKREKGRPFLAQVLFLGAAALAFALAVVVVHVLAPFLRSARDGRVPLARAGWSFLGRTGARALDTPFLVDPLLRCRVSGRAYPLSATLAGLCYRYFNVLLLAALCATVYGLVVLGQGVFAIGGAS